MRKHQSEALDLETFGVAGAYRMCEAPGCRAEGVHRAPKGRGRLTDYFWFCLEHVREYNKAWNYFDGLSDDDVEREIRRSTTWERPSWPFGLRREGARIYTTKGFRDPFDILDDPEDEAASKARNGGHGDGARPGYGLGPAEQRAFRVMGLEPPVGEAELKAQYKKLVKRHHPDANGGDKAAEERLKLINEAYTTLKRFLS